MARGRNAISCALFLGSAGCATHSFAEVISADPISGNTAPAGGSTPDASAANAATTRNGAATNGAALGDIVTTAQRGSEQLQDVPVAVIAVSPQVAQQLWLRNLRGIMLVAPATDFGGGVGYAQLYIRGIGQAFTRPGLESPVTVYLDGIYLQRTAGYHSLLDVVDPGSVEVLRGPQGTLYGRNAAGGLIRLNSALPTDDFSGRVQAECGRFKRKQVDGMVNIRITSLTERFAGRYLDEDGYIHSLNTGGDTLLLLTKPEQGALP